MTAKAQPRIPVVATLVVLAAVAVMVRLGFWQIDRLHQKEALLARYATAQTLSSEAPWPASKDEAEGVLFRHSALTCVRAGSDAPVAGRNAAGRSGWAHVFPCNRADGSITRVVLGWSEDPAMRAWPGGAVAGLIAPGPRLIADHPIAGLEANARPDPRDIPNNHFAYAIQWFLFALTALVIYALALRKRLAGPA